MTDTSLEERSVLFSEQPATRGARVFAVSIVAASALVFLALVPFANVPLVAAPAFIPIYQSALVITDLVTAIFLFGQFHISRSSGLCWLACGYLFAALIASVHLLTFPGLFSPTGLLGAGPQTTAWLYMFWHVGFPLLVIAYAVCGNDRRDRQLGAIATGLGAVLVAVCGLALVATLGHDSLPPIMQGHRYTPAMIVVVTSVWALSMLALGALLHRRSNSMLDLWLIVVMCAWIFDIALSAVFNAGRYDLGFYAGRIYGLMAASFVLVMLLVENSKLYVHVIRLRDSERQKAAELRRLSVVDALTGIANRRAFDDALEQEWRRAVRHRTALSLVMIDVDYFKRFNDTYGHVAGDQCLRTVAQAVSGKARRAGEIAARYGGEEFAVVLPHTEIEDAARTAERMCDAVRERKIPHAGSEVDACVTISVGVASAATVVGHPRWLREGGATGALLAERAALVKAADEALYQAKSGGRNRVVMARGNDDAQPAPESPSAQHAA